MKWNLIPNYSIGPIKLMESIESNVWEMLGLFRCPELDFEGDIAYQISEGETMLYIRDGLVDSVGCYENLYYNDINIFGLTLYELRRVLGEEDEVGEMIGGKEPVEYEKLGLQVWMLDKKVVDATCYKFESEEI